VAVGVVSEVPGLDPLLISGSGTAGGNEGSAMYDTIVRFNPETKKYDGRTAASLDPNGDFTEWTLRLKPNIRFGDGTAYDAEAVKFNIERHMPATSRSSTRAVLNEFVQSITVVDAQTVRFTLKKAWPAFSFILTQNAGMIASPTAIRAAGAEFNTKPGKAGAGPFEVASYAPKESLVLRRNPTYYGGEVYLDELKFVPLAGGDQARLDALTTGTLQVAILSSDPVIVATGRDKFPALTRYSFGGSIVLMNAGLEVTCRGGQPAVHCAGKPEGTKVKTQPPTADIRMRKAVQAAIDTRVVNERAWGGKGLAGGALFPKEFPWDPGVAAPTYDLNEAKRLVEEVKRTTGWNGAIRLSSPNEKVQMDIGLAVKTMLEQAGMQVTYTNNRDTAAWVSQVTVDQDFELALPFSYSISDDDGAYNAIFRNLNSPGAQTGYAMADMDAAIDALRQATTDDAKRAAYRRIGEIFNRDAPAAVLGARLTATAHTPRLHGFQQSATSAVHFDKVWLAAG
jgi:peptide/nickel transport system substrate-binding protein